MTINDLKIDIITVINQLSDISMLTKIRQQIQQAVDNQTTATSIWKGADVEIRNGVSFEQLMQEQNYTKISFEEFVAPEIDEAWEVSIDELLNNAN